MSDATEQSVMLDTEMQLQLEKSTKQKPIITPGEARKILGKQACGDIDDEKLTQIIITLEQLCRLLVLNLQNFNDERRKYGTKN